MGFADRFNKNKPGGNNAAGDTPAENTNPSDTTTGASGSGFSSRYSRNTAGIPDPGSIEKKDTSGSFSDNLAKKTQPKSYTDKVTRRSDLVYLVHGKDKDRDAWHYVLVDKNKLPMFLKQIETGSIDVALFGEVLRSGWGKNPSPEIVKEIEDEFGG